MSGTNHANENGFAGGATVPEPPEPDTANNEGPDRLAVPADDLTGSLTGGIDELTHAGDAREDDPR